MIKRQKETDEIRQAILVQKTPAKRQCSKHKRSIAKRSNGKATRKTNTTTKTKTNRILRVDDTSFSRSSVCRWRAANCAHAWPAYCVSQQIPSMIYTRTDGVVRVVVRVVIYRSQLQNNNNHRPLCPSNNATNERVASSANRPLLTKMNHCSNKRQNSTPCPPPPSLTNNRQRILLTNNNHSINQSTTTTKSRSYHCRSSADRVRKPDSQSIYFSRRTKRNTHTYIHTHRVVASQSRHI